MENIHAKIGVRVFWNDPDDDTCSGPGKIIEIKSDGEPIEDDTIIVVQKDDGGEVETTVDELELLTNSVETAIFTDPAKQTCEFVTSSDLFNGFQDLWTDLVDSEPDFQWGANNRSLVTIGAILDHCDNCDVNVPGMFRWKCNRIGSETYVDLEN